MIFLGTLPSVSSFDSFFPSIWVCESPQSRIDGKGIMWVLTRKIKVSFQRDGSSHKNHWIPMALLVDGPGEH